MWTDSDLQHDVESEIRWELNTELKEISVAVKDGTVKLNGHVDSYWERCAAEQAAGRVAHVKQVANAIRVVIPFADQREDDEIALAAMTILEWNALIPATVEVKVEASQVVLSGSVERYAQKREAERAVRNLRGASALRNEIEIRTSAVAGDAKTGIDSAFRRSALIDGSHIKTHVIRGIASLRGSVRSRAEHEAAMLAAGAAPGVTEVEDHLMIGPA